MKQAILSAILLPATAFGQAGTVLSHQKISDTEGDFTAALSTGVRFGLAIAALGDLDGDGVNDIAVGAEGDDDGGPDRGAVYVLFLRDDGTVDSHQKISSTSGGFAGALSDGDKFGASIASLGDLDGAGPSVLALAVGAIHDDDGGDEAGAVWVLFLNPDGTVASQSKISETAGGFGGDLSAGDAFGVSAVGLGDLDGPGPGATAVAVGALHDADGGPHRGAVWVLFLDAGGGVVAETKISDTQGGFGGGLDDGDRFGRKVAAIGDLDLDGVRDLAVGAEGDDDGGANRGAVWVLFLRSDGSVRGEAKISDTHGRFDGVLDDGDRFSRGLGPAGDLDCDGIVDLAVGATHDDDGGTPPNANRGAVYVLFLRRDGTVRAHQKISATEGGFGGALDDVDVFGVAAQSAGDLDGEAGFELVVGAIGDDDGGADHGAVWVLFLDGASPGPLGTAYCPANPNSTGAPAALSAAGSPVAADACLVLTAEALPPNETGYFLASLTPGFVPNPGGSDGNLCVVADVARLVSQVQDSGPGGAYAVEVDLSAIPTNPPQTVLAGETWHFQSWYRDVGQASNFTDAVAVAFR